MDRSTVKHFLTLVELLEKKIDQSKDSGVPNTLLLVHCQAGRRVDRSTDRVVELTLLMPYTVSFQARVMVSSPRKVRTTIRNSHGHHIISWSLTKATQAFPTCAQDKLGTKWRMAGTFQMTAASCPTCRSKTASTSGVGKNSLISIVHMLMTDIRLSISSSDLTLVQKNLVLVIISQSRLSRPEDWDGYERAKSCHLGRCARWYR